MTVGELINYLQHYADNGNYDSLVEVCDLRDNPLTEGVCISGAVFFEKKDCVGVVVLQTG